MATGEAASVVAWFEFYTRLYEDDARVARPSRTLLQLLQSAFPSLYEELVARRLALGSDEWACVIVLLEAFYEVELGINRSSLNDAMTFEDASLHSACIDTLEYVVSALVQSDSKTRFVGDIMTMEDSVQVDIMAVIERVLKHTASLTANGASNRDEDETIGFTNNSHDYDNRDQYLATPTRSVSGQTSSSSSPAFTSSRSPLHLAKNAEMERLQRANDILKEDSIHIAKELEEIKSKLHRAEAENTSLHETIKSVQLQAEMDILKKERTVRSYFDERMHSLQRELDRVTSELEEKAAVAKEVNELRDEIDLLRPSAEKLARAEATLAKYKTKIEDLASVKEKLRRTEEANADLVEKNLFLENQAAKTAALQRKLADSKDANTAIQFHVSELESKLSRLASELEAKRLECTSTAAALLEAKSLNSQLQRTVDQQIDAREGFATSDMVSAGGISELNPELMEKLARLEHENATLRSQVDGTTSDRIDSLLDDLEDIKRMKKSFEAKYFDTNDALKEAEVKLKTTEDKLSALQEEFVQRTQVLHDTTAQRDKLTHDLENAERMILELTDLDTANKTEIQRRIESEQSLDAKIGRQVDEISSLKLTLRQTVQELQLSNERKDRLCEDVAMHQLERHDMVLCREKLRAKIQNLELERLNHISRIAELESDGDELRGLLDCASKQISCLQESEARLAMRCEELHVVLTTKSEQIDDHVRTMSQLTTTQVALEGDLRELEVVKHSRDVQIQLQKERLQLLTEDLAMIQTKRFDLAREVERHEVQERRREEELRQAREISNATVEDYEHRMCVYEELKAVELATLASAHEANLQAAANDRAQLIADHEGELEKFSQEQASTITRMTTAIDEKCALLQQAKNEMNDICKRHECAIEELRVRLQQEVSMIQKEKDTVASEFSAYAASHSFLDDEVTSKEVRMQEKLSELSAMYDTEKTKLSQQHDMMSDEVRRLKDANRDMNSRFEIQEAKLREAVKSQLEANRKLMEVNQAMKSELTRKEAHITQLENAVTRLDSRIRMFERERSNYSSDDGSKLETDDSSTSYSSQLNSHLTQITEELELLRKENRKLQERLSRRVNDRAHDDDENALQSTKSYLMDRIRQLELAKAAEEDKKRELLLVNAKLIQDRKQIQVRNASDSKEVLLLKEKVHTWMLRDERRKKEHEVLVQRVRELESANKRLQSKMLPDAVEYTPELESQESLECQESLESPECQASQESQESKESQESHQFQESQEPKKSQESQESQEPNESRVPQETQESQKPIDPSHSASSEDQENIPPSETRTSPSVLSKKRKIDSDSDRDEHPRSEESREDIGLSNELAETHHNVDNPVQNLAVPAAAAPRRTKRRMSLFMSSRMTSAAIEAATHRDDEKPSECQQQ